MTTSTAENKGASNARVGPEVRGLPRTSRSALSLRDRIIASANPGAFLHTSASLADEPAWEDVDLETLPGWAFADHVARTFPHHFVNGGEVGESGRLESGALFLHADALERAWKSLPRDASPDVVAHLRAHMQDLGLQESVAAPEEIQFKTAITPRLRAQQGEGKLWDVRIIEAGPSLNGPIYPAEAVKAAIPIFEGISVFAYTFGGKINHLPDEVKKVDGRGLVGNLIGVLVNVHWNEEEQSLDGQLKVYSDEIRELLLKAHEAGDIGEGGSRDVIGLSIDARGVKAADGKTVIRFTGGDSVDLVTSPAAGGRIRRLVESLVAEEETQAQNDLTQEVEQLKETVAALQEQLKETKTMPGTQTPPMNAGTLAGKLSALADRLSAAADGEQQALLKEAHADITAAIQATEPSFGVQEAAPAQAAVAPDNRLEKLTESLKPLLEGIKDTKLRESLAGAAGIDLQPDSADKRRIRALESQLRDGAINREFGSLKESLRLPDSAMRLVDRSSIKVSDDYQTVTGLKEALDGLIAEMPYLPAPEKAITTPVAGVTPAQESIAPPAPTAPAAPVAPAAAATPEPLAPKAAPRGQGDGSVPLRESVVEGGDDAMSDLDARREVQRLKKRALQGDPKAAADYDLLLERLRSQG